LIFLSLSPLRPPPTPPLFPYTTLFRSIAPQMVARFKKLIAEGFYNGTAFHRINAAAGLIQGGDPLSKDNDPENDGAGDSPYGNRSEEHTSELQSRFDLVCRLLLEKKKK